MKILDALNKTLAFKKKKVILLTEITLDSGETLPKGSKGVLLFQHDDGSYHYEANDGCSAGRLLSQDFKIID